MVQANSIAGAFYTAFNVPTWVTGIFTFIIAGFIFIGGIRRIASFAEKMVPIMPLSTSSARSPSSSRTLKACCTPLK